MTRADSNPRTRLVDDTDFTLYVGDVRDVLAGLPDESVHCVVTSPPYWGLRDYGTGSWDGGDADCDHVNPSTNRTQNMDKLGERYSGGGHKASSEGAVVLTYRDLCGKCGARRVDKQLGLEATPDEYVQNMVGVFREVRRVLRSDGTLWLNLGDSYSSDPKKGGSGTPNGRNGRGEDYARGKRIDRGEGRWGFGNNHAPALKPKDLVGIPWRVAFALQADGWYLRSDIIWSKPNPMPESVTDRPTKAHEYLFLLTRSPRYFYDADAIREQVTSEASIARNRSTPRTVVSASKAADQSVTYTEPKFSSVGLTRPQNETLDDSEGEKPRGPDGRRKTTVKGADGSIQHRDGERWPNGGRNRRSVWEIATEPYPDAHFATFPQALVEPCVLAGTSERGCCPECGAPWERQTERHNESTYARIQREHGITYKDMKAEAEANGITPGNVGGTHAPGQRGATYVSPANVTTGWRPTCDCLCPDCTVDSSHDGRMRELRQGLRAEVGKQPVAQEAILRSDVREQVPREQASWPLEDEQGIHQLALTGPSGGEQAGASDGASAGDGGAPGTSADSERGRASQERDQGRQSTGEPGSDDGQPSQQQAEETASRSSLPTLRAGDLDSGRDKTRCRACDAPLATVPAVVCDPFLGSGTTAVVARRLGRRSIGIELNAEYAELVVQRTKQLSLLA